ncbi:MAG TPA: adenine phosphoribosyltransferase [Acidimicrobiales bacterium]|jgi:adenine phosphoribosyltransferase|nr:adenine phosphoribosyltransferase [Acidimicrobiales bacterium]
MGIDVARLKDRIRDVADFPRPGVVFKDITPLLGDAAAFGDCVAALADRFADSAVDKVMGIEARGFIIAAPVAQRLGAGFVPVRKAGKLPWRVEKQEYVLEYGTDVLEVHCDGVEVGERVLIVDDVLATGGTAEATARLAGRLGAVTVGFGCIIELAFLGGRQRLAAGGAFPVGKLDGIDAVSLVSYGAPAKQEVGVRR